MVGGWQVVNDTVLRICRHSGTDHRPLQNGQSLVWKEYHGRTRQPLRQLSFVSCLLCLAPDVGRLGHEMPRRTPSFSLPLPSLPSFYGFVSRTEHCQIRALQHSLPSSGHGPECGQVLPCRAIWSVTSLNTQYDWIEYWIDIDNQYRPDTHCNCICNQVRCDSVEFVGCHLTEECRLTPASPLYILAIHSDATVAVEFTKYSRYCHSSLVLFCLFFSFLPSSPALPPPSPRNACWNGRVALMTLVSFWNARSWLSMYLPLLSSSSSISALPSPILYSVISNIPSRTLPRLLHVSPVAFFRSRCSK